LNKLLAACERDGTRIIIADLQYQPLRALARAGVAPVNGVSRFTPTLADALVQAGEP
jgi:SulP family sulfate permease